MRYIVWMKLFEYLWVRNGKICHLWAEPVGQRQSGTSTESGYRYPLDRGKVGTSTDQNGTGAHSPKGAGTCTDQSGSGTDASSNL